MNVFNRLIMLIIALLLIAVPVFLLLVGLGVLSAQLVGFSSFRNALEALQEPSVAGFDMQTRTVVGIIGVLVALVALLLLLREFTFGPPVDRKARVDDTPGRETLVTAQAVRHLAEGAAREVGAVSPTCYLDSEKRRYNVSCNIRVPRAGDFTELAARSQQNIRRVLEEQQVPVNDVEVTVQGTTAPQG